MSFRLGIEAASLRMVGNAQTLGLPRVAVYIKQPPAGMLICALSAYGLFDFSANETVERDSLSYGFLPWLAPNPR